MLNQLIELFKDLPGHLELWATAYGTGIYLILFAIIFAETGLVFTPFLPGDSLLFAVGALLSLNIPNLDIYTMIPLLIVAAVLGDTVNYHVGQFLGNRLFKNESGKLLNKKHLEKTREFYLRHGGKTIVFARFIPIIRTYAPFVAGMGAMKYSTFILFNVVGGAIWISSFILLGYFFGNLPVVKSNFQYLILGIIVLSVLPLVVEYVKAMSVKTAKAGGRD